MEIRQPNYVSNIVKIGRFSTYLMCDRPDSHTDYPEFHTDKYTAYQEYSEYSDYNNYNDCGFDPCNGSNS